MGTVIACVICLMMGGCMGFIVSGLIFADAIKKAHEELDRAKRTDYSLNYFNYPRNDKKENGLDEYRL